MGYVQQQMQYTVQSDFYCLGSKLSIDVTQIVT